MLPSADSGQALQHVADVPISTMWHRSKIGIEPTWLGAPIGRCRGRYVFPVPMHQFRTEAPRSMRARSFEPNTKGVVWASPEEA
jgi:hypothetical protein